MCVCVCVCMRACVRACVFQVVQLIMSNVMKLNIHAMLKLVPGKYGREKEKHDQIQLCFKHWL